MFVVYRVRDDYRDFENVLLQDIDKNIFFDDEESIYNAIKKDIVNIFKEDGDLYKEVGKELKRDYNIVEVKTKKIYTFEAKVQINIELK